MATDKKPFILYADQKGVFEQLPDEKAGQLIKHLFAYINDENPETDDLLIKIAFEPIKMQLKRDLEKWKQRAENSRLNGAKGGRPKKTQQEPKKPNGLNDNPTEPEKPVSVTVTVNDNVNVNENVINTYEKCILHFPERLLPEDEKMVLKWQEEIEKLNRIDNIPFTWIEKIVEYARNDDFWQTNFLSILKLRKKDKQGMKYVQVFYERMKAEKEKVAKKNEVSHINFDSE